MYCYICGTQIKEVIVCDIVLVDGKYHYEEIVSPVLFSEELNVKSGKIFDYDFYKKAVAKRHMCAPEDVASKYIDGIDVPKEVYDSFEKQEKDLGCRCPVCEDFI